MTEQEVVKILQIMQSGTDVEKEVIRKLYPEIHKVYIPTIHDCKKYALRYLYELNNNNGTIDLNTTIVSEFHHNGANYEFLTTVRKQKLL